MAQRKGINSVQAYNEQSAGGKLRFNTSTSLLEYYDGTAWKSIDAPPTVSGIDVTDVDSSAGGNQTFVISGSGFSAGGTEVSAANTGSDVVAGGTVTRDSSTQVTAVAAAVALSLTQVRLYVLVTNAVKVLQAHSSTKLM